MGGALDFLPPERDARNLPPEQALAGVGADHLTGECHVFEPDGHVPRLAHQRHSARLRLDDGGPGMDADPGMKQQRVVGADLLSRALYGVQSREAGPGGAACGVLIRHREPEARQQPLVGALQDRSAELTHRRLGGLLERVQHASLVLRVEFQIRLGLELLAATDQHGQLAALGLTSASNRRRRRRLDSSARRRRRLDSSKRRRRRDVDLKRRRRRRGGLERGRCSGCRGGRRRGRLTHALQILGEVPRRGVPILLVFRERLEAGSLQVQRNIAHELTRGLRLIVAHLPQQLHEVGRPEREAASQQLIQHNAQTVDVRAAVDAMRHTPGLFGRHVVRGAGDETLLAAARTVLAEREAEVHQHRRPPGSEDDVLRFDVAVDDAPGVRVAQRVAHRGRDARRLGPRRAVVPHPAVEVGTLDVIGDDVHLPLMHPDVVDGHDARVVQAGQPPRLLPRLFGIRQLSRRSA
jgi:hypothetical protein